jgi:hypothetical protein
MHHIERDSGRQLNWDSPVVVNLTENSTFRQSYFRGGLPMDNVIQIFGG